MEKESTAHHNPKRIEPFIETMTFSNPHPLFLFNSFRVGVSKVSHPQDSLVVINIKLFQSFFHLHFLEK